MVRVLDSSVRLVHLWPDLFDTNGEKNLIWASSSANTFRAASFDVELIFVDY